MDMNDLQKLEDLAVQLVEAFKNGNCRDEVEQMINNPNSALLGILVYQNLDEDDRKKLTKMLAFRL